MTCTQTNLKLLLLLVFSLISVELKAQERKLSYDVEFNVPYDSLTSIEGANARAAIENFHKEIGSFVKNELQRDKINLIGAIGHLPVNNYTTNPDGTTGPFGVDWDDDSWWLDEIDVVGISTYGADPRYMYKSSTNNYGKTFSNINFRLKKPVLLVETDLGDGTQSCTFNEQAVMVANRLGTSGCGGFNIWSTYGAYAPVLPKIVKVSNMMNSDFVVNTLSEADGNWEHQSSLWKVKVDNPDEKARKPDLRELQFIKSENKTGGFGTIYNRQFNVQNYADISDPDYSNCHIGYENGSYPDYNDKGYMFIEGWESKNIKWNDKKKLKVTNLKKKTDYLVKYYDYSTLSYRSNDDHITKSSNSGKLKIKHPKLSWGLSNNSIKPIYFFTVEEQYDVKSNILIIESEIEKDEITETLLYPNPNNGVFTIEHFDTILSYQIIDVNGRIVKEKNKFNRYSKNLKIETNLLNGMYIIVINNSFQLKFIIYDN